MCKTYNLEQILFQRYIQDESLLGKTTHQLLYRFNIRYHIFDFTPLGRLIDRYIIQDKLLFLLTKYQRFSPRRNPAEQYKLAQQTIRNGNQW